MVSIFLCEKIISNFIWNEIQIVLLLRDIIWAIYFYNCSTFLETKIPIQTLKNFKRHGVKLKIEFSTLLKKAEQKIFPKTSTIGASFFFIFSDNLDCIFLESDMIIFLIECWLLQWGKPTSTPNLWKIVRIWYGNCILLHGRKPHTKETLQLWTGVNLQVC